MDKKILGIDSDVIFKELYNNSPDLYRTVDTDGKIILCNRAYAENLGHTIDEVLGCSIFDHVADKSLQDLQNIFQSWLNTGKVSNHQIWLKRKDGTSFPCLLSVNNLYSSGQIIGSNTVIRDISEIVQAKHEIDSLKAKRFSIIGELSSRIAHDLRNPLSVIRTCIEVLHEDKDPFLEKRAEYFKKIDRAIIRMAHQIDEVMDYVKPKPLDIHPHSLKEIIHWVIEEIGKSENIIIVLPQNDIILNCDYEKIEIVFANLILNAIQAMNNFGTITIRIIDCQNSVKLEAEDTGDGISDQVIDKVFEPLFTTRQIGTGLGLASCKSIVEKHNGRITVETGVGKGTTFVIDLPKNL
jgi:PAS domain S-box-containing protein